MADELQFQVKVSADTAGLVQTEAALRDVASAAKEAAKEGSLYTDEQKRAAQALADSLPPLKQTAQQADNLAKSLSGTKQAISGLGNVIGGVLTADLAQASKGLLDLSRAASAAEGAFGGFLKSVASGAAIGAALAAPLVAAIKIWRDEAAVLDEQLKEIWAGQGQSTRALAAEHEAAAARAVAAQERAANAYKLTTDAINAQARVAAALAGEKTKQAALGATTPGEKQAIEDAAAVAGVDREIETAQRLMKEADAAGDVEGFNRARDDLKILGARRQTATMTQATNREGRVTALGKSRIGLAAQASEQQAAGDFAGQAATVAEIRKLDASLKANGATVAEAVKAASKTVDKSTAKVKATRENGGGG